MSELVHHPRPMCGQCRKPVECFTVTREADAVKFEAECHGGAYEMVRIFDRDDVTGLQLTEAFRRCR